jgi:hypothetical protein
MTPAENAIKPSSWRLLTRCTKNTGKAPTAVAMAASKDACTPGTQAPVPTAPSHHKRVGAQKVLSETMPAMSSTAAPKAKALIQPALGGTGQSKPWS